MSNQVYSREAEDRYEAENDNKTDITGDINDSSYAHPETKGHIPVQSDTAPVEDPIDVSISNTDEQLGLWSLAPLYCVSFLYFNHSAAQDEKDAIDKSNIIGSRTRGAKPTATGYSEGPDEDDLPQEAMESGRSSTR
ncbi:MAG: hypothetical protein Q9217_003021 [Psora testacea]